MNAAWHRLHVLGRNATPAERMAWHREHEQQCACRPIPPKLRAQMEAASRAPRQRADTAAAKGRGAAKRSAVTDGTKSEPRFAKIVAAFAGDERVTRGGKGFGSTGLKVDGKLFAMVASKGELVVKLPRARVEELVRLGRGVPFDPGHGRLMKEWLAVAVDGASSSWLGLAGEARTYAGGDG